MFITPMSSVNHYFLVLNLVLQGILHKLPESHRRKLGKANFLNDPSMLERVGNAQFLVATRIP